MGVQRQKGESWMDYEKRMKKENPEFLRRLLADREAERDYEMRAAFGRGAVVVNVFTGKRSVVR
jgi:hypothetical protein